MSRRYYRLSLTRDTEALRQASPAFHGMFLEAHIVELYVNAVTTFLATLAKPYAIDPALHKFAYPAFGDVADKRWVAGLSESYGIDELISQSPEGIQAGNLAADDIAMITRKVLEYQRSKIAALSPQAAALQSLLGGSAPSPRLPEFLVAPYFYAVDNATSAVCKQLLAHALRERRHGERVYAPIAMPGEFLGDRARLSKIIKTYTGLRPDGYLLWLGDFRDWEEHPSYLFEMARLAHDMKSG